MYLFYIHIRIYFPLVYLLLHYFHKINFLTHEISISQTPFYALVFVSYKILLNTHKFAFECCYSRKKSKGMLKSPLRFMGIFLFFKNPLYPLPQQHSTRSAIQLWQFKTERCVNGSTCVRWQ